jgi:hypothetical protein
MFAPISSPSFSTSSGTAFDPASPGPIGNTTPNIIQATRSTLTGNGEASNPVEWIKGFPYTGGTGATTVPLRLMQPHGVTAATT